MSNPTRNANNVQESATDENILTNTHHEKYETPEVVTEDLMTFGALCNGSKNGGRKSTTAAPNFCNANRLLS